MNEEDYQQAESLSLLQGLAAAGVIGGGLTGAEVVRRKKASPYSTTYGAALEELGKDIAAATRVTFGKTPHDRLEEIDNLDPGANKRYRSIRDFSDSVQADSPNAQYRTRYGANEYQPNPLTQAAIAARDGFNPSGEDFLSLKREFRQNQGFSAEGPRSDTVMARIPGLDGVRDALGTSPGGFSPEERAFRDEKGLSIMRENLPQRLGGVAGRLGSDFINNGARSLWWILNAPQAVVDVATEGVTAAANKEGLYGQEILSYDDALANGWIDSNGEPRNNAVNRVSGTSNDFYFQKQIADIKERTNINPRDPNFKTKTGVYSRRRMGNNLSTLMALPAAIAINSGIGLNSPLGGEDGRKAIFQSDEDPTQTSNVLAEVAAKYILGRQGDLLAYDDFKKVRPDVSKAEYNAYKAHRWDKNLDLNPFDDGRVIGPLGVVKYTSDGINGAEVQFLGKDMPMNTAILPTLAAIGGTAVGAALGRHGRLNPSGIEEGINRAQAIKEGLEMHNQRREAMDRPIDTAKANKAQQLGNKIENLKKQKELVKRIPGISRVANKNAAAVGLIAGGASWLGSSLIGNELERRRRENNAQELGS